jgi:hypothetical protein
MKTEFNLIDDDCSVGGRARIVNEHGVSNTCLTIKIDEGVRELWVQDKDLEKLAINILKALKSKHLK